MSSAADDKSPVEPGWEESMKLLDSLPGLPLERRAELLERLVRSSSPGVRERALRIGAAVLSDEVLVAYMRREGDAVLRNAGLEILKQRGGRSFAVASRLLADEDPAIALQAVQILDHLNDPRAVEPLRSLLAHEDPNVVQATIVAIGHLGDARTIPDLLPFLDSEPWVQCAAIQALGAVRAPGGIEPLAELLTDLSVGTLAAEALAQIGGQGAFEALQEHWLEFQEHLDPEATLGLLAHVLEGLPEPPPSSSLRPSLADRLRDPYRGVRQAAARCLLALGAEAEDGEALSILAAEREDDGRLPSCLEKRPDLVDRLLAKPGLQRMWGLRLLARHPGSAASARLATAIENVQPESPEAVATVAEAVAEESGEGLGEPLLKLYLRLAADERDALRPALEAHGARVEAAMEARGEELAPQDAVVLAAVLGRPADGVQRQLAELEPEARVAAIAELADHGEVVRGLPWERWLADEPERYGILAARVAVAANLRDLLPALRRLLVASPGPAVVRALGRLGDAESLPSLIELLEAGPLAPVVIESLGRIGGPEARAVLRRIARGDDERLIRVACRALADCAVEEDEAFFRQVAAHPDWYVRLASVEVLGRFERAENLESLTRLAADPVEIVAQRAQAALEG